jgi:hypothetical protein
MRDRQTCIDCGKLSPETETNYTLISAQFGWRLARRRTETGEFVAEWRCAECWREHKKKTQGEESPSGPERAAERRSSIPKAQVGAPSRSTPPPSRAASKPPPPVPTAPRKRS